MDGLTYAVIGILGGFSVLKMLAGKEKMYATLFLNIVFGGALYLMLNICDFTIPFNTIEWENGADFAPEYLYEISEPA